MFFLAVTGNIWLNILLSVFFVATVVASFLIVRRHIEKNKETVKHSGLIWMFILQFLLVTAAIAGLLIVWGYDFYALFESIVEGLRILISEKIGLLIASLITIFVALLIYKISHIALFKFGQKSAQRRKKTVAKVTLSIVKYSIVILCVLVVLAIWGVNVMPAIAGLGVAGLVIGLGAQKFINDLISGFFIIFEHHFDVGDIIEVKGFKGEVIDIGLKTTKIKNWLGQVKILANGDISDITNCSLSCSVAVVTFGIDLKENIQNVLELLQSELTKRQAEIADIIEAPSVAGVTEITGGIVTVRVTANTVSEQQYGVERKLRLLIKEILQANDIEIALPQMILRQNKGG